MARVWDAPASRHRSGLARFFGLKREIKPIHLQSHVAPVVSCAFGEGHQLVTFSRDNTARVWSFERRVELSRVLPGQGAPLPLRSKEVEGWFARIGKDEVVSESDWNEEEKCRITEFIDEGSLADKFTDKDLAKRASFVASFLELTGLKNWHEMHGEICVGTTSRQADIAAKPSKDRSISLFEISTGRQIAVLHGHRTQIRCLAFTEDLRFCRAAMTAEWSNYGTLDRGRISAAFSRRRPLRSATL